jgi:outer membrane biosynthesis protein TonB
MATIKIEITYDPSKENLEQALASLQNHEANALGEAVTQEVLARMNSDADQGKPETPAPKKTKAQDKPKTKEPDPEPETPAEEPAPVVEEPAPEAPAEPEKPVTKTDVRAIATALSKKGKREELAAIFAKFGAKNLSTIKESDYPALMRELVAANA